MSVILPTNPTVPLASQADLDALSARVAKLEAAVFGSAAVFTDDFTTLDAGTFGGPNTWAYVSWFNPDATQGVAKNQAWEVNPLYAGTPIQGLYSAANSILSLDVLKTPTQYAAACGNLPFVSSQLIQQKGPFLTYGRWEAKIKVKPVKGTVGAFWLLNTSGAFPPGINFEFCVGQNYPPFVNISVNASAGTSGTQVWNFDISQWHVYDIDVRSDKITFSIDGAVAWSMPTPAPVGAPMRCLLSNQTSGLDWLGPYDGSQVPGTVQVDYVRVYA